MTIAEWMCDTKMIGNRTANWHCCTIVLSLSLRFLEGMVWEEEERGLYIFIYLYLLSRCICLPLFLDVSAAIRQAAKDFQRPGLHSVIKILATETLFRLGWCCLSSWKLYWSQSRKAILDRNIREHIGCSSSLVMWICRRRKTKTTTTMTTMMMMTMMPKTAATLPMSLFRLNQTDYSMSRACFSWAICIAL